MRALTGDESFVYDETSTSFKDAAHGMSMDDDGRAPRSHEFGFDAVYDERASQEEVYARSAKPAVLNALRGYNATVLAYGQTGTGKTYTMEGDRGTMLAYGQQRFGLPGDAPATDGAERGIIPRAIEDIFDYIAEDSHARSRYLVRVSYLQIYNETVSDLLKPRADEFKHSRG